MLAPHNTRPFAITVAPDTPHKLRILADAAKYDASCASSGSSAKRPGSRLGKNAAAGICHSWSSDGRCISLLKLLFSNDCIYDCAFCVNRRLNNIPRATFSVKEVVDLTINFYVRNYIEGLFLSSAVFYSPNRTMEALVRVAETLRWNHAFGGYIHLKTIPGADPLLVQRAGRVADRLSVNIELPTEHSLTCLAPQKHKKHILEPMKQIGDGVEEYQVERRTCRKTPPFAPAGQSTQVIVGASPERDGQILRLSDALYRRFDLRRVYYSAYVPVNDDHRLPNLSMPPLLREHRLYQADWLLRFYGFRVDEIVDEKHPDLDEMLDPKTGWALRHPEFFPVEINHADYETLLRVPGIGVKSAQRILSARRFSPLRFEDLIRIGITMKRARYFITCTGRFIDELQGDLSRARRALTACDELQALAAPKQLELF